jgi:hypothetical protein
MCNKEEHMRKSYPHIGFRPVGRTHQRLEAIRRAAKAAGRRRTVSSLVNDCIAAHLPTLEKQFALDGK